MTRLAAMGAGILLGLAYFGGLWLTVRQLARHPSWAPLLPAGGAVRLALLGAALATLGRLAEGADGILAALGGLWIARSYLVGRWGGIPRG